MNISVLIPCYNAAPYLGEALASVLAQETQPFEIIVIDDGSTDGSEAVARRFAPRVKTYRQKNLGISAARNRALGLSRGETIAFLDADDLWPARSLASRAAWLADHQVEFVSGLVEEFISPDLSDEARRGLVAIPEPRPGRLIGTLLVRRRVFDRIGGFDTAYQLGETIDWVARATNDGSVIAAVPEVVLRRRLHTTNTGTRISSQRTDLLHALKASIDRRRVAQPGRSAGTL